jgi:hypothetical protein
MEGCDKFQVYKSGPLFISSKGITLISAVVASIFLSFTFNVGGDLIVVVVDGDDDNDSSILLFFLRLIECFFWGC